MLNEFILKIYLMNDSSTERTIPKSLIKIILTNFDLIAVKNNDNYEYFISILIDEHNVCE